MNVETFFRNLPPDEFQGFETDLREALINVAAKAKDLGLPGGRFPLQTWIDRRLGGEVTAHIDSKGYVEVSLIVSTARPDETFFANLDDNSFSKEESDLRESIFDFLAAWQSSDLATFSDLSSDANVTACVKAFLPPAVSLEDWIERRIGGEVEIQQGSVQVLPEARKIVCEKYEAILRQQQQQATTVPARFPPMPPPAKGGKGKGAPSPVMESKEKWLERLPSHELTGDEVQLRQALLDWLDVWARRPTGRGLKGAAPLIGDAMTDPRISQHRTRLLPANVSLKDWIEARIGGEVELRENQRGQMEVLRGGETNQDPNGILDSLPEDALNDQELELRQVVLGLIKSTPQRLQQLSQNPAVVAAKRKFLPDEVTLTEWIDRRIGAEVEVTPENWVRSRNAEDEEAETAPVQGGKGGWKGAGKDQSKDHSKGPKGKNGTKGGSKADSADSRAIAEKFFQSLPDMSFTEAEETLRDSILCFLENWTEEEAPSLSKAMLDPDVRRCKLDVLPKGNVVSLKEWIERRLMGELEIVRGDNGSLVISICGDAEPSKRQAANEWEQSPGKMPRVHETE